ncbi:Trans-1,2-dihydrobenzene-1,2-diol dehydrogenase [Holothuria leucospilota]|uniref:Trans-1,2-dihydrobenzene-1,2-diol dehydrogenase n=1 Tax=Holothuria leucospilota TaxID=206669 RepID=A0A9Q1H4I1_HOLLE|nr:Trans-1,2-dihydrobenzene-1,2-diol dehydrogenase [Holothuria leucospilota]
MALRWDIWCAGNVSHDFTCGVRTLDRPFYTVVIAVASRSLYRGRHFAKLHKIPEFYGSYAILAADKDVDMVYVVSTNSEHLILCTFFLNHKEHVLCEKTLGLNLQQVQQITNLARRTTYFIWREYGVDFFPVYKKVRDIIAKKKIGAVKIVRSSFGLPRLNSAKVVTKVNSELN